MRQRNRNKELVTILGPDRFAAFFAEFHGQRIWIPMPSEMRVTGGRPANQPLVDLLMRTVGLKATERLRAVFGGEYIEVPMHSPVSRLERDRKIAELHRRGWCQDNIAKACGVSRRTVIRRLNEKIA